MLAAIVVFVSMQANAQESSIDVVRQFVDAYNSHDVGRMESYVTDKILWMSVTQGKINIESSGKSELSESMQSYFEGLPSTGATLRSLQSLGDFVTAIEESHWESKGEAKSQCAVTVYQLVEGLIENVWYFDARPCEAGTE
jgi:ketosteroid isomerase-like protein